MSTEAIELARYYSVADTARCLAHVGLTEARVRDWQIKKFIAPALTKGRVQYARVEVVRMFVLAQLQVMFGQTIVATRIAQAISPEMLERTLDADEPQIMVLVNGCDYRVTLPSPAVQTLRERMAEVPR